MGYYTKFELATKTGEDTLELFGANQDTIRVALNEEKNYVEYILAALEHGESVKWYDFDSDMRKISKIFPDVVFQLTGYGEEAGDVWRCYYKNGKSHDSVLSFSDFNEDLLK
jgi:hypothetical protein